MELQFKGVGHIESDRVTEVLRTSCSTDCLPHWAYSIDEIRELLDRFIKEQKEFKIHG
jgi:Zn-finger domain-containing protein